MHRMALVIVFLAGLIAPAFAQMANPGGESNGWSSSTGVISPASGALYGRCEGVPTWVRHGQR